MLEQTQRASVSVRQGWHLESERAAWQAAANAGRRHLSVRMFAQEVLIGPLWAPGTTAGCAGCAETRARITTDHPLVGYPADASQAAAPADPFLDELYAVVADDLAEHPLAPGELVAAGTGGVRRHRVVRAFNCPICAPAPEPLDYRVPTPPAMPDAPASDDDPTRGRAGDALLRPSALRQRLVDARFGPVLQVMRDESAAFAMSNAVLPESPAMGYGRADTFARSEPVAILEAYERLGGFPHHGRVLQGVPYAQIANLALDPATLGGYTDEQLAHPLSRVLPYSPDTPLDWVWAHELLSDRPVLVPAEAGFFRYDYQHGLDRHSARRDPSPPRRRQHIVESSSGCALGGSLAEATLHSLFELAERDAFLIAWHRAVPLPEIDPATVTDPLSLRLLDRIRAAGYEPHLLVATCDIDVPVVWGMALHGTGGFPATWSAAGTGVDGESAVRAALWELTQLVTSPIDYDRDRAARMLADPWLIDDIEDHIQVYNLPETLPRVSAVLGGPRVTLPDAFPNWPDDLRRAAGGRVRGALDHVRDKYVAAGLDTIAVVDQSTRDHADLGLAVAKAVVPGIVPMCFGHAQQRLSGLPRLTAALFGQGTAPYDPHPFP